MMNLDQIRKQIDAANAAYYQIGETEQISNAEYDSLKDRLKELDPTDKRLQQVGHVPNEFRSKVSHPIPMGSLDNTDNGIDGYRSWFESMQVALNKTQLEVMATLKIDGNSIRASYDCGKLIQVASRGNGEIGEDISQNGMRFKYLPTLLHSQDDSTTLTFDIRGEAILYKKDFEAICVRDEIALENRSNPRNIGSGIIGRDNGKDSEFIRFMPFNIDSVECNFETETEKLQYLKKLGFSPVPHKLCYNVDDLIAFYNSVLSNRDTLPFEIDGIVVVLNELKDQNHFITKDIKSRLRPKFARAIKFPHKSNSTKLLDVLITVGHSRAIIPTAVLQEVRVGGVNVTHALLNNWDEIERLKVAIGDEVEVVLSGDIIPKLIRVIKSDENRRKIVEPINCPACGSATTREYRGKIGAITYCSNKFCDAAMFGKIDHWIGGSKKGVGILGIGDGILQTLWNNKLILDPADLYTLTIDKIKDLKIDNKIKIGDSRAKLIIDNINKKKKLSLPVFLGSLGIDLLGRRRVKLLIEAAKGQLDSLNNWLDVDFLSKLELPGFGNIIKESIVAGINENRQLIDKLLFNGVSIDSNDVVNVTNDESIVSEIESKPLRLLESRSFCWTGTRELIEEVEAAGGIIKSGISKGLQYLVQKDATSQSNKTIKAESLGTKIISVDFLRKVLAGEATLDKS